MCFATQEATNGKGPDVIIEMLANVNLEKDLQLVNKDGIIVVSVFVLFLHECR